jgi:hypothetical protein
VSEKELTAASIEDALRDLRGKCISSDPEWDAPEYDWDGVSPINGEAVTQRVRFTDREYVFTEKCVYRLKGRAAD